MSKVTISQLRHTDHTCTQHGPATRINISVNIWLIIWYRGREESFMHIHTHFQRNWINNVNFTAHLIRVGSIVNFTVKTHRSHKHVVQRWESIPVLTQWLVMWYRRGEEPFMHIHTNFHRNRGTWWPHKVLIIVTGQIWTMLCVCDRCVVRCEIVTFDTWPHPH